MGIKKIIRKLKKITKNEWNCIGYEVIIPFYLTAIFFCFVLMGVLGFAIMGQLHNMDQGYNIQKLNFIGAEVNISFIDHYNITHYKTGDEAYIEGFQRLPGLILYVVVTTLLFVYCFFALLFSVEQMNILQGSKK